MSALDNAHLRSSSNKAVKRLLQECKELNDEQSRDFTCEPLEDDIFEWHFALRGPPDTEFEGGIYHGRIVLPPEYPFKPPAFSFLTPNGRFEVNTKICLSISAYHPEHWQPSWSIRTALVALAAFFPTTGDGAIGALAYSKEERKALAAASRLNPPTGGQSEARAAVTRAVHERMLAAERSGSSKFSEDAVIASAAASITRKAIAAVVASQKDISLSSAAMSSSISTPVLTPASLGIHAASSTDGGTPPPHVTRGAGAVGDASPVPTLQAAALQSAARQQQQQRSAQMRKKSNAPDDKHLVVLAVVLGAIWLWLLARRMLGTFTRNAAWDDGRSADLGL